jgi:tetratricopeptide (TPR) repeat protein
MVKKQNVTYAAVSLVVLAIVTGFLLLFVYKADDAAPPLSPGKKSAEKPPEARPYETSALYKQASGYSREGNIDKALEVLDDAKIEKDNNKENRAGCFILKARLFMKKNQFQEAVTYYQKALSFAVTDSQKAEIFSNLGNLHRDRTYFREALDAYNDALNIYRKLAKKKPDTYLKNLAVTLYNKGILYLRSPGYEATSFPESSLNEALGNYEKLAKENPDTYNPKIAEVYQTLAVYYKKKGDYTEAAEEYGKALRIYETLDDEKPNEYWPALVRALNNLALLDSQRNHPGEALANLKEALNIYRRFKKENPNEYLHDMEMSRTLANLGNFYRDNNQFREAEKAYEEALTIRERLAKNNPGFYYEFEAARIQLLMGYLYRGKNLSDIKNEESKRKGLSVINRAITFCEKYKNAAEVVWLLDEVIKLREYFRN